ncbi:MAG: hypothetical protein K6L76_08590 [Agarilytica sp.]
MKKAVLKLVGASIALMAASVSSVAETYQPAMFGFTSEQFSEKLIETNAVSIQGKSVVLYCQSEIDSKGVASNTSCYDKSQSMDLVGLTESVLNRVAFTAAQVNGKAVPVKMSYRVGLAGKAGKLQTTLIPNLGSMQARYGRDYIAPQERLDMSDWYTKYNDASWVNGQSFLGHGPMARVAATVDEKGKTDVVREMETERAYKRDVKIVKNALRKSRFIPGFVDGRPVSMGYLAVVNYGDEGEAVSAR